jgi:hypothetical protein
MYMYIHIYIYMCIYLYMNTSSRTLRANQMIADCFYEDMMNFVCPVLGTGGIGREGVFFVKNACSIIVNFLNFYFLEKKF